MTERFIVRVKGDGRYIAFGIVIKTREEREILERVLSSLRIARFVDDYTIKELGTNADITRA